jgi:hypothetical protein
MPRGKRRLVQTSGVVAAKPVDPTPIPDSPAALLDAFKDYPAIDIVSRQFQNPNDPGSLPILLKDEDPNACINSDHQNRLKIGATVCQCGKPARKWYVRWFNLAQEGRNAQMRAKGFIVVEVRELQDADDISDMYDDAKNAGQKVRRGDRGQEVLGKMPLPLWLERKRRQREIRNDAFMSAQARREERAESAGRAMGDEAGQTIYDGGIREERFRSHKTNLGDEALVSGDDVE